MISTSAIKINDVGILIGTAVFSLYRVAAEEKRNVLVTPSHQQSTYDCVVIQLIIAKSFILITIIRVNYFLTKLILHDTYIYVGKIVPIFSSLMWRMWTQYLLNFIRPPSSTVMPRRTVLNLPLHNFIVATVGLLWKAERGQCTTDHPEEMMNKKLSHVWKGFAEE